MSVLVANRCALKEMLKKALQARGKHQTETQIHRMK